MSELEGRTWSNLLGKDIIISIISEGIGLCPEFGQDVIFSSDISYRLENEQYIKLGELVNYKIRIGEGDCVPGLELSLRHSKATSEYICRCASKYGFTQHKTFLSVNDELIDVPDNAELEFHVHVQHVFRTKPVSDMNSMELVGEAIFRKEVGNRCFKLGDLSRALRVYSKAVKSLSVGTVDKDADNALYELAIKTYIDLHNNLAACYMKISDFHKAREATIAALEVDPNNKKSLLKAATACIGMNEFTEARAVLGRLLELDPTSHDALVELRRLDVLNSNYLEREKLLYSKMSRGLVEEAVTPTLSATSNEIKPTMHKMDHIFPDKDKPSDDKPSDDDNDPVVDVSVGAAERRKKEDEEAKRPLWMVVAQEFVISGVIALGGIIFLLLMRNVKWELPK